MKSFFKSYSPLFTLLMIIGFTDCPDQNSPSKSLEIWNTHVLCLNRSFSLKGLENDVVRAVRFMYSLTSILRHTSSLRLLRAPKFLSSQTSNEPSLYIMLLFFFFPREFIANDAMILCCNLSLYFSRVLFQALTSLYALRLLRTSCSFPLVVNMKN